MCFRCYNSFEVETVKNYAESRISVFAINNRKMLPNSRRSGNYILSPVCIPPST